jgi:heme/copper-type cytochrome/quinol oxidase subunit 3
MEELDKLGFTTLITTGHESLKALLVISVGASALFMTFFGTFFGNRIAAGEALPLNVQSLADATIYLLIIVSVCMLSHGVAFLSHFAYYERCKKAGTSLMITAGLFALASLVFVILACINVIDGITEILGIVV